MPSANTNEKFDLDLYLKQANLAGQNLTNTLGPMCDALDETTQWAKDLKQTLSSFAKEGLKEVNGFLKTGKLNLRNLLADTATDLLRVTIKNGLGWDLNGSPSKDTTSGSSGKQGNASAVTSDPPEKEKSFDLTKELEGSAKKWAGNVVDELGKLIMTGKFDGKKLITGIATDFAKLNLKNTVEPLLNKTFKSVGEWISGKFSDLFKGNDKKNEESALDSKGSSSKNTISEASGKKSNANAVTPEPPEKDKSFDFAKELDESAQKWAGNAVDELGKLIMTGKFDGKNLMTGMATDFVKLNLKNTVEPLLDKTFKNAGEWASGKFSDLFKGNDENNQDPSFGSLFSNIGGAFNKFETSLTGMFDDMGSWFSNLFSDGSGGGFMSSIDDFIGGIGNAFGKFETSFTSMFSSMGDWLGGLFSGGSDGGGGLMGSIGSLIGGMGSYIGDAFSWVTGLFGFANGGIMSANGPLSLRAYARGGIANSPQLALFGEGSMNEAFVPLPDGRSIPVTMNTGGNTSGIGNQSINISINVNQATGETSSTSDTNSNMWTQLANRVKDVVRDELTVQQRPGGVLYR